jgi:hypothetical protein
VAVELVELVVMKRQTEGVAVVELVVSIEVKFLL